MFVPFHTKHNVIQVVVTCAEGRQEAIACVEMFKQALRLRLRFVGVGTNILHTCLQVVLGLLLFTVWLCHASKATSQHHHGPKRHMACSKLCDTNMLQGSSSTLTYVISMTMAKNVLTTSTRKLTLTGLKLNLPSVFLLM